jgi:hypothetical protein
MTIIEILIIEELLMKNRPEGFLNPEFIDPDSEQFDYIRELHGYLWRFVRFAFPDANALFSRKNYLTLQQRRMKI